MVSVRYLLSNSHHDPSHLRKLPTKSLSTSLSHLGNLLPTVLVIHVSYLLNYFPPHPSLNRLRTLLTKSLPKALGIYVRYVLVYFPRQPSRSHRCKLLVYFPPQPSLSHLSTLLTKFLLTTALVFCLDYLPVYLPP